MLEMAPIAWKKSVVIDANQHKCQHHNKLPLLNNLNCNTEYLSDTKFFSQMSSSMPPMNWGTPIYWGEAKERLFSH